MSWLLYKLISKLPNSISLWLKRSHHLPFNISQGENSPNRGRNREKSLKYVQRTLKILVDLEMGPQTSQMNSVFPIDMLSFFFPFMNLSEPALNVYFLTLPGRNLEFQNDGLFLPQNFIIRGLLCSVPWPGSRFTDVLQDRSSVYTFFHVFSFLMCMCASH